MPAPRYRLQFPRDRLQAVGQDQAWFTLLDNDGETRLRFHDYAEIYRRPGLYEQMFYDRLQCSSPDKVGRILEQTMAQAGITMTRLRALDLGAGNGIMGDELKRRGVSRIVGLDLIPEAREAAYRDRPHVYDDYVVGDVTALPDELEANLREWNFDCLTSVAALGFGDIPPHAFIASLNLVQDGGWVAFNIKESFLENSDQSGFSRLIRDLIFSVYLEVFHLEKYRHRLSIDGEPLFYFAMVAKKLAPIPESLLAEHGVAP